jgi:tRNA-specific 2-thiouridylase
MKIQSIFFANCRIIIKSLASIGELTKPEEIAAQMELVTAEKKDSQGLCFIGSFTEFAKKFCQKKGRLSKLIKRFYICR